MSSSIRPRWAAATALVCAAALGVSACGSDTDSGSSTTSAASGPVSIVASTNVWGDIASAVAGDKVKVTSIINDPSADPHSYETSPSDAAAISGASLVVYNGGGYDTFFTDVLGTSSSKPSVVAYGKLTGPDATGTDGEEPNEHVWYQPAVAVAVAKDIADRLGSLDSANAATYTANAASFESKVAAITAITTRTAKEHPGAPVAQTEPIAHYLLEAAGSNDLTPKDFEKAIEDGSDPSPASIAATQDLFTAKKVEALVYNNQTQDAVTQSIRKAADQAGIPVVEVTETLPAGTDYVSWQTKAATDLEAALTK